MKWREFSYFMNGLDHKTPLGRIVSIRAENNPDVLKEFTPEQRRIRTAWKAKQAKAMPKEKAEDGIRALQKAFFNLAGVELKSEEADNEED